MRFNFVHFVPRIYTRTKYQGRKMQSPFRLQIFDIPNISYYIYVGEFKRPRAAEIMTLEKEDFNSFFIVYRSCDNALPQWRFHLLVR